MDSKGTGKIGSAASSSSKSSLSKVTATAKPVPAAIGKSTPNTGVSSSAPINPSPVERLRRTRASGASDSGKSGAAAVPGKVGAASKVAKDPVGSAADKALKGVTKRSETAGAVAKGALQGASKGGVAGAALGAAKGATKTKNGRRLLIIALVGQCAPLIVVGLIMVLVFSFISGGKSLGNADSSDAARTAGFGDETISLYSEAQNSTGTPWQVLASIQYEESGGKPDAIDQTSAPAPSAPGASASATPTSQAGDENYQPTDQYVGPFHISKAVLDREKVNPKTVLTIQGGAEYIGGKVYSALLADKNFDTQNDPLDSGLVLSADADPVVDDKDPKAVAVAAAYPKAIATIPVENMDSGTATRIFHRALAWAIGVQYNDGGSNLGVVCSTSAPSTSSASPSAGASASTSSPLAQPVSLPSASPTGSTSKPGGVPDTLTVTNTFGQSLVLNKLQLTNASIAIGVATKLNINTNGQTAMLMTAIQESKLLILANQNVPESETNPNKQGDGNNYDSLGTYQQRAAWGTVANRMEVAYSTLAFLGAPPGLTNHPRGLLQVDGWQTMAPGVLAQTVQVSGAPTAYDQWLPAATTILGAITGASCSDESGSTTVSGDAKIEAAALLTLADKGGIVLQNSSRGDLEATKSGAGFESCGHHVSLDSDLMHWYLILATKYVITVWNFATAHGCDPYYHPPGMASDIGAVQELTSGRSTNFYPGAAGNNPSVVTDFINFAAASGPDHEAMGQQQCGDHSGGGPKYQAIAFSDSCTHQHINVHQNDPQWGPYIPETWPAGNGPKATTGS